MHVRFILPALLLVAFSFACKEKEAPVEPTPTPAAEPAAPPAVSDPICVGRVGTGTPETLTVGPSTWELNGSTLKMTSAVKGGALIVGAITDIKEDTEENKANLKDLVAWFIKEKVDLVVVAGDTGETQAQIEAALDILAGVKVPVFNIIGNREGKNDYQKAMVALRAKHGNIFDLNAIRRVDTPVADLVSLPGYFNPAYIHNQDGCQFFAADVAATGEIIKGADSPVVLVSHGGPLQEGPLALDRTAEGANVGSPEVAKLMAEQKVPFGIFGNIHEAGGRGVDLKGATVLEQDIPHEALYLNPGPADSVRWVMNDGSISEGMGAILVIKDGKAAYRLKKLGAAAPAKKKGY